MSSANSKDGKLTSLGTSSKSGKINDLVETLDGPSAIVPDGVLLDGVEE